MWGFDMPGSTRSTVSDPLLQNALDAIENGMEDFIGGVERRVSSAVRNIYAGVLLLLKEKLRLESPPSTNGALIFKTLVPERREGQVLMVAKGRQTVDLDEIRARLSSLNFDVDWARVETLRKLRNDVEHHHAKVPHAVMQQAIADAVVVIVEAFTLLSRTPSDSCSCP
jgi:hypothetical protein